MYNEIMARIFDKIDLSIIDDCELIVCNNVAHYFYSSAAVVLEPNIKWSEKDFPQIAPPFQKMFLEWKVPTGVYTNKLSFSTGYPVGVFIRSQIMPEHHPFKWSMDCQIYCGNVASSAAPSILIAVNKDGSFSHLLIGDGTESDNLREAFYKIYRRYIWPALLSIAFMHCKNIEFKTVVPPASLSKKQVKKTGRPLFRYKVLEIEPMKRILRTEGKSELVGLKHALHICRGHFKDYSEGGGLFGKYKGMYWWESHVRGDPSNGVVAKDYEVNSPLDNRAIM